MLKRFEELKRHAHFTDVDAERLAALYAHAAPHFREIARAFYERIREHQDARAVLPSDERLAALERALAAWLERLLTGKYDDAHFVATQELGRVHVTIGLPQRYLFTAMALIRRSLTEIANAADPSRQTADAISRVLDLELAIMVESYRDDMASRPERRPADSAPNHAIARAEIRYASAVEMADALFVGLDASGRVTMWNREAERVTGYPRDAVLGHGLVDLILDERTREEHRDYFGIAGATPPRRVELPLKTRSGSERYVRWRITRMPPAQAETAADDVELLAMGYDVTDERAARLQDAQQERLAAMGALANGLAHEIRNPLNGALLNIAFLERSLRPADVSADVHEAARMVTEQIQRLGKLMTDFMEFARPTPLSLSATSLRAICERAVQLMTSSVGEAVTVKVDLPASDVVLPADKVRLERVLHTLLENAVDSVAPRGGTVTVRARREPDHVWIEVEDDGPGINTPDAPVFDAFYSTKPRASGLGLAVAHRAVTDHGGKIGVDSKPGRTRFRVELPLAGEGADA